MKKSLPIKYLILMDIVLACGMTAYWINDDLSLLASLSLLLTVLIAACPLPLSLASPLALWLGKRRAARQNIIFHSGKALAKLHYVDTLVLSKNGTITEGNPYITDLIPEGISQGYLLAMAASAERESSHPIARVIYRTAVERGVRLQRISAFNEVPGCGVEAIMSGNPLRVGTAKWIQSEGFHISANLLTKIDQLAYHGKMPLLVTNGKHPRGIIALEDIIRRETTIAIHRVQRMGIRVMMLTGDSQRTAAAIQRATELDDIRANLPPDKKAREIQLMRAKGHTVAMAGNIQHDTEVFAVADLRIDLGQPPATPQKEEAEPVHHVETPLDIEEREHQSRLDALRAAIDAGKDEEETDGKEHPDAVSSNDSPQESPPEEERPATAAPAAADEPPHRPAVPPVTADLTLAGGLADLRSALRLAHEAHDIIQQNKRLAYLTWLLCIPTALGLPSLFGYTAPLLFPIIGAVSISSLLILLNSLRMR